MAVAGAESNGHRLGFRTKYAEMAGIVVGTLLEDREGTLWAGGYGAPAGRLCAIRNGSVRCDGEDL
jgi:hypothetical protein